MKKIITALLVVTCATVALLGVSSTRYTEGAVLVQWTQVVCHETGGVISRHVSICVVAKYVSKPHRCPDWRKVRVYIGKGGGALEEGNGAIVKNFRVYNARGRKVFSHDTFNLLETNREDHYRRTFRLGDVHGIYLESTGDYELLIDQGKNRTGSFNFRMVPWVSC